MAEMELCERLMILRRGEDWRMWGETEKRLLWERSRLVKAGNNIAK